MTLEVLGWDEKRTLEIEPWAGKEGHQPGRVLIGFNYLYRVGVEDGEFDAVLSGRLKHHAERQRELPAVGDWVVIRKRPQ
jgi:ribosome biogenesis GTPase